ncbi:hypothetical protein T492DRAFT_891469 [Pavlovales sp. CCMP2436]|nr:hypothetical protein T492DRAFT_891469 [Pavlovales sp. CCMP2436]
MVAQMAASLDELLRGAQRLSQHDGSSFAPIRRDLSQIRAQTANLEARTARADGEGGEAERRAQAVLFLARRGVDATAMDTDGLLRELDQSDEPYFDPASDAPPDDIDGWLQAQRERIVSATIDGARAHTSADFFACAQDRWQVQWRQDHALTLAALSHRSGGWQPADMNSWQAGAPQQFAQQAANVPAAAGLRAPGGLADSGVGLVREPKAAAYAMALLASHASIAASVQVGGRGASQWSGAGAQPDALVCRFSEVRWEEGG